MSVRPPPHDPDEGSRARPSLRLVPGPAPQPLTAEQQQLVLSVQRLASQLVTELCGYVTPEERDELVAEANVAVTFAASDSPQVQRRLKAEASAPSGTGRPSRTKTPRVRARRAR